MGTTAPLVYVGSSPAESAGDHGGIAIFAVGADGALRPATEPVPAPAPSFLAAHPQLPVLYAVSERMDGGVLAFTVTPAGGLLPLSRQPSGGSLPIHLAVSSDGRYLLCANWGDGAVAVLPVGADGRLGPPAEVVRYEQAYAHHVSFVGADVTVVHMGGNCLRGYRLAGAGRLDPVWTAPAQAGAGPRHLALHPSGRRYVADELGSTVSTYVPDPETGGLRRTHVIAATLTEPAGPNHLSEIALSPDGRHLYVASRGNDSISTFSVDGETPEPLDEVSTGGVFPRHFALAGPWLFVANERSDSVTVLRVDGGLPRPTGVAVETPTPTCVLPRP